MPLLALLATLGLACLGLGPGKGDEPRGQTAPPLAPSTATFRVSRLAFDPLRPGPHGRAPAFELPMVLPDRFALELDVWADRDALGRCRVVGQRLGPPTPSPSPTIEPEAWHHVRVDRGPRGLSLAVDGRAIPADPGLDALTPRLVVEPCPDRPALFRNLTLSWDASPAPRP